MNYCIELLHCAVIGAYISKIWCPTKNTTIYAQKDEIGSFRGKFWGSTSNIYIICIKVKKIGQENIECVSCL